jgi:hypothetical protein
MIHKNKIDELVGEFCQLDERLQEDFRQLTCQLLEIHTYSCQSILQNIPAGKEPVKNLNNKQGGCVHRRLLS